ncbi:MAG: AraC family transcriptional regulator [Flavobacteriales bacterium]|jgi:AraC-like DNA-binding protein|nr:AraC family transcriptional regulator [Flavobacteriales bacterium]
MGKNDIFRIKSVTQFYEAIGKGRPNHPLIGVFDVTDLEMSDEQADIYKDVKMTSDLYSIILKDGSCGMQYGRNKYDFEEGVLQFIAPNQIVTSNDSHTPSSYGFFLVFHPDLIRNFDLGKRIKKYNFFNYGVHEALHLSKKEENTLIETINNIKEELRMNIDKHSQEVLVTNIQLLLNYSQRFYERQFITRTNSSSDVVSKVEELIQEFYAQKLHLQQGTPSPEYFAEKVNYSNTYLSDLLKKETGKSTKDHIDEHIIELAKVDLAQSEKTINEIAYDLGFNYPHYFSRLFKKKTGESPNVYRSQFLN